MVELRMTKREMREIIMRTRELREFHAQGNLPSPIRQVRVPIWHALSLTRGLPNPICQVIPLISQMCSYPPHCSHLHPPCLSFSSTTLPSSQNTMLSHPLLSHHVVIMSWHRVQHTPSTISTHYCVSSLHSRNYELTPECSFICLLASLHDRPWSASSPWQLQGEVTLSHSNGRKLTNWWNESQHPARRPLTASKFSSKHAQLRPSSSYDHWLQVHLRTPKITASKVARSWPPSVSPNWLDSRLQVHLETHSITISECISKFTPLHPPSSSANMLYYRLHMNLQTRWIMASESISEFARSSFSGVPEIALKHHLQAVQIFHMYIGSYIHT